MTITPPNNLTAGQTVSETDMDSYYLSISELQNVHLSGLELLDNSTTTSIPTGAWTALAFSSGSLTTPANLQGTLINVNNPVPGAIITESRWYTVTANVRFASGSGSGRRGCTVMPSGQGTGTPSVYAIQTQPSHTNGDNVTFTTTLWCAAGITLVLYAYNDAATSQNLTWRRLVVKAL